ncbi:MAG: pyridoxamine 5'-phosphate oxidase [Prevotellaceae bacterium]|jgi:pyridoxamine 5'-phosphate oxidase|nr:pyridoxamine 5'-phosphate oxidase [Prevotellaceae bacterium]
MKNIADIRKEYTLKTLNEADVSSNPIEQFTLWMNEAIKAQVFEPTSVILATATFEGKPSARTVLLKGITENGFIFFTNYESKKARQILQNPYAAMVFFWLELERQVRIEGRIKKIPEKESNKYFNSRPVRSKLGAWASPQSQVIPSRKYLEELVKDFEEEFAEKEINRPSNWGGYILEPNLMEFWQGHANQLHDRLQYTEENGKWKLERLAP